jgi:hypothetical protein
MTDTVQFNSCGDVCKGVLTRPGGKSDNVPLVIMAGGWCYTKEIVMPWYGKFFEDLEHVPPKLNRWGSMGFTGRSG